MSINNLSPAAWQRVVREATRLRLNWKIWDDVARAEVIVWLRKRGVSLRKLAAAVGCSEGLIRHLEIVGRLPVYWKAEIRRGAVSTREVVGWVRGQCRAAAR